MSRPTADQDRAPKRNGRRGVSRRGLLAGGAATGAAALPVLHGLVPHQGLHDAVERGEAGKAAHGGGSNGPTFLKGGTVDHAANGFNPTEILRDFDWGKTRRLANGRVLREWTLVASDKEIEVAPGVHYAAFIVDPKQGRDDADELLMVMNGFNTNFDAEGNQIYGINTVAFHYVNEPIKVGRGEPVRIYLANLLEFDPINSFHIHANF